MSYNLKLADQRAESVAAFLEGEGVKANRIILRDMVKTNLLLQMKQ